MGLTLVLGPANSAKAGEVLGAFAEAAATGALLVVPTVADVDHFGRELAQEGTVFGSVVTFSGLASEIARRAGYGGVRLSAFARERVLARALAATPFQALRESAGSRGFILAAGNLIAELERSLIAPERFGEALGTWAAADPRRGPYAHELASVYGGYAAELGRIGRVDSELYAWRALDALRAAPGAWGADAVFFYGFDELTPLERDAVATLARVGGVQVMVSLNYEPGRAAFAARAETAEELRSIAQRVIELPAVDSYYAPRSRGPLHHLERHLFEGTPERVDPGPAIRLLEAGGERAEAELLAAEVLAMRAAGVAAPEIAVVCRSLSRSGALIERVFAQYGVVMASSRRMPISATALGRGLLGLARCAWLPDASAPDLLAFLRMPGLLRRPEVADRLEFQAARESLSTAAEASALLDWDLDEIERLREAPDPAAALAREARRLLARPHRGEGVTLAGDEELDARALAVLLRALEDLEDLGEHPPGAQLVELLEGLEVGAGLPPARDDVLLAEPLEVRARRFRAVLVFGLQEGEFPRPGAPEPFLPDERRRELAGCSALPLRPAEDSLERERYLFYACASRASEQLVLSYRSSDEEGNLELPSPLIADVEELLVDGWATRRRRRLLADVVWQPDDAPTERERARAAAAAAPPATAPDILRRLAPATLAQIRHHQVLSAGALECYADCPVRWLVERELQPATPEPDPEPIARGNFVHAVMEELLARLEGPLTPSSLPDALKILEDVLPELPAPVGAGLPEPVRVAVLRGIEADLRRYLAHESADGAEWVPHALELRFGFDGGEDGGLPPVTLGDGEERISLRGVIDRVDIDSTGRRAIVRDYKSGSTRPEYQGARWSDDRRLQVALYMLAVRQLLELDPVAGFYQPVGGEDLRPRGVYLEDAPVGTGVVGNDARSRQELEEVIADAQARALAIAARLRSGEVEPSPQTCSRDGCRYPGICRSQ